MTLLKKGMIRSAQSLSDSVLEASSCWCESFLYLQNESSVSKRPNEPTQASRLLISNRTPKSLFTFYHHHASKDGHLASLAVAYRTIVSFA
jgi:hypothetical protein